MKRLKKILISISTVLILLIVWGYFNIWRSPKFYLEKNTCSPFENILTMKQYGEVINTHKRPYIIKSEHVLVFGSEHTKNPNDSQIETIETVFNEFKPTIVLVEGRLGFLIPYAMNPIKNYGEMGKAAELAKKYNLPLYSWDTPKNEQLNALQGKFTP